MHKSPCPDRMQRVRRRIREHAASRASQWREGSRAPGASSTLSSDRGWRAPLSACRMKMRLMHDDAFDIANLGLVCPHFQSQR